MVPNFESDPVLPDASFREFPCPACAKWAEVDRVKVMQAHCLLPDVLKNVPEAVASARRQAAHRLVDELTKDGNFLRLTERDMPANYRSGSYPESVCYQVTIGVVSKDVVASLDERVARHQEALAKEVIEEGMAQIQNWGSQFNYQHIDKSRAYEFIRGALTTVLNRRKAEAGK